MERDPVRSEALRGIGYDVASRTLEVEFASGAVYRYFGVPDHVHLALMAAESHGRFYADHIRDAGFDFEQVA